MHVKTPGPNKIVPVVKEVIAQQLLVALVDKSKVACVFSEKDLNILISALSPVTHTYLTTAAKDLLAGLVQLRQEAFG